MGEEETSRLEEKGGYVSSHSAPILWWLLAHFQTRILSGPRDPVGSKRIYEGIRLKMISIYGAFLIPGLEIDTSTMFSCCTWIYVAVICLPPPPAQRRLSWCISSAKLGSYSLSYYGLEDVPAVWRTTLA